jgi:hypothetical protein
MSIVSSVAQSFFTYVNSLATVSYPTVNSIHFGDYAPVVPFFLLNKKTNQAIPVIGGAEIDTGAEGTLLNQKYAPLVGVDLEKGIRYNVGGAGGKLSNIYYLHRVKVRIGNLQPVETDILFGPIGEGDHVIGRSTIREYVVMLTLANVRVSDRVGTTTTNTKKSAYVKAYHAALMNAGNAQANFRNRI